MARLFAAVMILLVGSLPNPVLARPVSYQGGWTVIQNTDRQTTALWVHYTFTPKLSIGWRSEWDRRQDIVFNGVQATYLAKRWFGEDYQANLYATGGAGIATPIATNTDNPNTDNPNTDNPNTDNPNPDDSNPAVFAGVIADWETRRLYVSYRNRILEAGDVDSTFFQAARVGFAPYEGDTGDLHTWLMVEIDHRPDNADPVGITPLVRFFKGSAMFEAGWSITDNQPLINFTYRF